MTNKINEIRAEALNDTELDEVNGGGFLVFFKDKQFKELGQNKEIQKQAQKQMQKQDLI